ncbi:MAG: hypothetical protein ABFS02_12105, partial [Pseudomonadota bacterium]
SARIGGAALAIATQIILARISGADALGIFFLALSLATILSIVSSLGYPWIAAPIVAQFEGAGEMSRLAAFVSWAKREIVVASLVLAGLAAATVWLMPGLSEESRLGLTIGILSAPIFAIMRLHGALANASKRFVLAFLPELFLRPLFVFGFVCLAWAAAWPLAVPTLILANLGIAAVLAVAQAARLRAKNRPDRKTINRAKKQLSKEGKRRLWRRQALPMIIATLFIGVFADLDIVIVGFLFSEEDIAVFGAALKISMFLAFYIQAVHQVILRDAATALQGDDHLTLSKIIGRANIINILASIAALIGTIVLGKFVLGLFGPEFVRGYECLVILVMAQLVRRAAGPAIHLMTIAGETRAGVPIVALGVALLAVANFLFIPRLGVMGGAVAVLLVTVVWTVSLSLIAKVRTSVNVATIRL